jgi:hypothetical protein
MAATYSAITMQPLLTALSKGYHVMAKIPEHNDLASLQGSCTRKRTNLNKSRILLCETQGNSAWYESFALHGDYLEWMFAQELVKVFSRVI